MVMDTSHKAWHHHGGGPVHRALRAVEPAAQEPPQAHGSPAPANLGSSLGPPGIWGYVGSPTLMLLAHTIFETQEEHPQLPKVTVTGTPHCVLTSLPLSPPPPPA